MNETFSFGGGPGGRGPRGPGGPGAGPGGPPRGPEGAPAFAGGAPRGGRGSFMGGPGGVQLDPLVAANNPNAPLASKLLAVPALRARYVGFVRELAERWLDWKNLGPVAHQFHALIEAEVKRDTKKLESYEEFRASLEEGPRSLKAFADQRRAFLLKHPALAAQ